MPLSFSDALKTKTSADGSVEPISVIVRVWVCEVLVSSEPLKPLGQAVSVLLSDEPFQSTQPCSLGVFCIVRMVNTAPSPFPDVDASPTKVSSCDTAAAGRANVTTPAKARTPTSDPFQEAAFFIVPSRLVETLHTVVVGLSPASTVSILRQLEKPARIVVQRGLTVNRLV